MPHDRHAHQHAQTRTRERRHRLAHEAARLMAEGGIRDYHQAKLKAAARLGIHDDASLPRNREIEDALREYQRLFQGEFQTHGLRARREAALRALEFFAEFDPRLVGSVLEGTADAGSPVTLHLYTDDPKRVPQFLDQHGIPAEASSRRLRLDRARSADFDVWVFSAESLTFDLTVLPTDTLRQAPLSSIDEKPMRRASAAQLRELLVEP
jgi:predicted nucleotidyltransferase